MFQMNTDRTKEVFEPMLNMNTQLHTNDQANLFLRDKQAWENAIAAYNGTDPLELWYNYICWYDYNIHVDPESKFREALEKCLTLFEHNEAYKQDVRIVKLWVKYIDLQQNPLNIYQILYQRSIGTQCSCFYIGWAHYYDSANAFKQAESVYNLGFQAKAEPFEELQEAHTKFRLSLSQRMLYNDNSSKKRSASHLSEQRQQITMLNPPKKTRSEASSAEPVAATSSSSDHNNIQTQLQPQSQMVTATSYSEINSEQCNLKNSAYVISSSLNYIYNDTQDDGHQHVVEYHLENVKLPHNFVRSSKNTHDTWKPLLFLEEPYDPNRKCFYRKELVYPGNDIEFSPDEIRSRKWSKKLQELRQNRAREQQIQIQQATQATAAHKTTPKAPNQLSNSTNAYNGDAEEQIEASTIRFSSDSSGGAKNKTITIKFRRDKTATQSNSFSSSVNYGENYEIVSPQNYSARVQTHNNYQHTTTTGQYHSKGEPQFLDSGNYVPSENHSRQSTPKPKKVKKIKIINKYDDPKYLSTYNTNSNSSSDYQLPKKSSTTVSRNQYDDANLLLSIANMHSNDAPSYGNSTSAPATAHETLTYNDDSLSNAEFNSTYSESPHLNRSNCSTPVRKLSQTFSSKTSTPLCRSLKRHTSNLSVQNDDSMCSYEQNSFFASEHNDELKQRRMDKALATIETHLAKQAIDPFHSELCKAFLTKIDFPSRSGTEPYKLVSTPIPKLANTKGTNLADVYYNIEKEVGRGSYGSVYKATNSSTGAVVALKFQKPPNTWEIYICTEVRKRIANYDILPGFMDLSAAVIAPNASILITEFSPYGSLLDINNKLRQATKKVMHESLVMHFSSQILNVVSHLHSCKIVHADIKPDNFLLMRIPNSDSHIPSLRLIDFGCAIDMKLFPENTEFKKVVQTDGFTCIEMQEGRHWSYQTDYFCIAGTVHVMLFGEYMQLIKKFGVWDIKQKLPRYLKKHFWTEFFSKMLNIKDLQHLPDLIEMKSLLDDEACKMDSELQTQIRTLSNLLHRR